MSLCQICSRTPREIKTETTFCQWNSLTHSILDFCSSSGTGARAGEEGRGGRMLKRNGSVLMKYLRGSDEKELTLRIGDVPRVSDCETKGLETREQRGLSLVPQDEIKMMTRQIH
jgi:hypothetical protein